MDNDKAFGCFIALVVVFVIGVVIWAGIYELDKYNNRVQVDEAVERFEDMAGTGNVEVVRHSNSSWVFGNANDVTFELLVDGKPQSGRCTSGAFSEMVCRLYGAGGE